MRETVTGFGSKTLEAGVRLIRLALMTGGLALLAGAGMRVFAQQTPIPTVQPEAGTPQAPPLPTTVAQATPADVPAAATAPDDKPTATPAPVGKDKKGKAKKVKAKKEKAPKLTPIHIVQGTLTVDGWTGKARLNYDIADLKYVYVWAPGIGTVVASNVKFPLGKEQPKAFNGNTLSLQANGHTLEIYSEKKLLKDKKPSSAWVYIDTVYKENSAYPEMGYGNSKDAPYAWPGAKETPVEKGGVVAPPPLPMGMRPTIARPTCLQPGTPVPAGTAAKPCPAPPASTPSGPAAAPPVPLPGYGSGTTTAIVTPAADVPAPPAR